MTKSEQIKNQVALLKMQRDNLIKRYQKQLKRDLWIKRYAKQIIALDMKGWPRLRQMPDKIKWTHLVYKAKIDGVYGVGNANCDVIIQLHRRAIEMNKTKPIKNKL